MKKWDGLSKCGFYWRYNPQPPRVRLLQACAAAFHEHDFLAGALGERLTGSILRTILPAPFPGRSDAIEGTSERAWRQTAAPSDAGIVADAFAQPFLNLWKDRPAVPALVLKTTFTNRGDRVPISNLKTDDWPQPNSPCKIDIAEHIRLPLSAAANVSARFLLLEEWGTFKIQPRPQPGGQPSPCRGEQSVADGGFYDNYGAATLHDALVRLKQSIDNDHDHDPPRIIVIQITSDPDCRVADALDPGTANGAGRRLALRQYRAAAGKEPPLSPEETRLLLLFMSGRNEVLPLGKEAPGMFTGAKLWLLRSDLAMRFTDPEGTDNPGALGVLLNARTTAGFEVERNLRCYVAELGGSYYHFSMAGAFASPFGWVLSRNVRFEIGASLDFNTLPPFGAGTSNGFLMHAFVTELQGGPHVPTNCPPG